MSLVQLAVGMKQQEPGAERNSRRAFLFCMLTANCQPLSPGCRQECLPTFVARILHRLRHHRVEARLGRSTASNVIRAWLGVRPPLRLLHRRQQQTMFSHVVGPPCDRGMT